MYDGKDQSFSLIHEQIVTAQPVSTQTVNGMYAGYEGERSEQQRQHVGYSATPTIVAIPRSMQASSLPRRAPPPPARWLDDICSWPSNLFPSCWCVCCCCYGVWLVSQMAEKTQLAKFNVILGLYMLIWLISLIVDRLFPSLAIILWLPMIFAFAIAIVLRLHIVRKYQITQCSYDPFLNLFGEFCCGFWCWYCSVAQMARYLYGYTKVFDGDSDIQRPDNYENHSMNV